MNLVEMLDRPIAYHRTFVQLTGSVTGAVLLSQSLYWQKRSNTEDGWWWKTQEDWEEETGLTRHELGSAKKACLGLLEQDRRGVPCRSFYRVDLEALEARLRQIERQTSLPESGKLDSRNPDNKATGIRQTGCPESGKLLEETKEETSEETKEDMGARAPSIADQNPPKTPKVSKPNRKPSTVFVPPALEEVVAFCRELGLPASDGEAFFWGKQGNGWKNGTGPVRDWKATVRNWKACGYMPSQKAGGRPGFGRVNTMSRSPIGRGPTNGWTPGRGNL